MKKICLLLVALIFALSLAGCEEAQEKKERDTGSLAMYTENCEITKGMLQYHFNTKYLAFVNANSEALESIGLDPSAPLSEQDYSANKSWRDYFLDDAKKDLENYLIVEELARKDKIKLSKSEKAQVEKDFSIIKEFAEEEGITTEKYIKKTYGSIVEVDDVKRILELQRLGSKCFKKYSEKIEVTDEALEKYYSDRKKSFSKVDYLAFETVFSPTDSAQKLNAGAAANRFAEKKTPKAFKSYIEEYITDYYIDKDGSNYDAAEVQEAIKLALENCTYKDVSYNSSDSGLIWAFDEEREAGDTKIVEDSENGIYRIYYLLTPMHREEYNSVDIRQIFFSADAFGTKKEAKKAADECLERLRTEDFSASAFEIEAKENSSDDVTKNYGGLQEKLFKSSFTDESADIRDWIFSEDRAGGDVRLIENDSGWFIVYIEKIGEPAWRVQAREGYLNSKFSRYVSDEGDNYVINFNSDVIDGIEQAEVE